MAAPGHGNKAVVAALLANCAIAVAKFAGFAVTRSSSMLAEGVHSVADTGNQALLLLGGRRSRRRPTEEHPFGYGRERYFWSFVVALVLFVLGAVFAIYEGIHKLEHPEPVESPGVALGILGFAIVAEAFSFRTAVRESRAAKGDATYWQFLRQAKIPELPVVLLEDLGAMCGLVIASTAIGVSVATDEPRWDGYGSIVIGTLLGIIAVFLVVEMKSLLIGESASRKHVESIKAAIEIEPGVRQLIHMKTVHLGPDELLVCAKVEFDHQFLLPEVAEAIDRVERNVRANVPSARVVYIEPDVAKGKRGWAAVAEHSAEHVLDDDLRDRIEAERWAAEHPRLPPAT